MRGKRYKNPHAQAFNSNTVFVRDDDGIEQIAYGLFPQELQPQLAKARAAASTPSGPAPVLIALSDSSRAASTTVRPTTSPLMRVKPPFPHETLGVSNGNASSSRFASTTTTRKSLARIRGCACCNGARMEKTMRRWPATRSRFLSCSEQLWAWDINFGFLPLDVPLDFRDDIARVASPLVGRNIRLPCQQYPIYRYDAAPAAARGASSGVCWPPMRWRRFATRRWRARGWARTGR